MPKRKTEHELEMWAADLLMEAHAIAPCPTTAICACDTAITLWTTLCHWQNTEHSRAKRSGSRRSRACSMG
jgi:ribosomal protein RSM22 (predicted rRNA methylase)